MADSSHPGLFLGTINKTSSPIQKYPKDLDSFSYFMSLHFVKYVRIAADASPEYQPVGNIYLPMPLQLTEEFGIGYNQAELGIFGGTLKEAQKVGYNAVSEFKGVGYEDLFTGDKTKTPKSLRDLMSVLGKGATILAPEFLKDTGLGRRASLALGMVQNPHMTTIFEGVELRKHSFSWIFSPRSEADSKTLEAIINNIRKWAHPKFDATVLRFGLDFPNQVFCNFIGTNYLYPVKRAVITSIQIDNAADGNVAFYGSGAPVNIRMTINLQETEILTQDDFNEENHGTSFTQFGDYAQGDQTETPIATNPLPFTEKA